MGKQFVDSVKRQNIPKNLEFDNLLYFMNKSGSSFHVQASKPLDSETKNKNM
jgi:hypothetical protein